MISLSPSNIKGRGQSHGGREPSYFFEDRVIGENTELGTPKRRISTKTMNLDVKKSDLDKIMDRNNITYKPKYSLLIILYPFYLIIQV